MGWQRLGRIWQTGNQGDWMTSHAALPFAETLDGGRFRIWFSTRNANNQSHIGWIEMDITRPAEILAVSPNPAVAPGPLGAFDDSGATMGCLVSHEGARYLYYTGWMLGKTVPFYFAVGLATTGGGSNCLEFEKISSAPVMDRNRFDPFLVASPYILIEDGGWRMWYVSGDRWEVTGGEPRHYYHIRYAESEDGIDWRRQGIVCIDFETEDEYAFARPSVIKDGSLYRMWYSYRGDAYRLGYAESEDGIRWVRKDDGGWTRFTSPPEPWESEMICYPHVFEYAGKCYMLYNGNGYGKTGIGLAAWVEQP